jgi:hypothetical protein
VSEGGEVTMRRTFAWAAVAFVLAAGFAPAASAPDAPPPDPMKRFGWFADLAGACWRTTLPDGVTRDTQCYEARYGRFVFGKITIDAGPPPSPAAGAAASRHGFQGESIFAWDDAKGAITFTFWGSNGNFGHGEAYLEGAEIRFPGFGRRNAGGPETRSTWRRVDADAYRVAQEEKVGERWTEKWAVVYRRVKA